MPIQLQCVTGDFDQRFLARLPQVETAMLAQGLEPSAFIISKERVQFTELPIFIRPGGDGFNYTVYVDGESFTVTKPNDMAFLGYFEQLCSAAAADDDPAVEMKGALAPAGDSILSRVKTWFNKPAF